MEEEQIQLTNIPVNIIAYFYSLKFLKQAYLRDIAVSVPEHCNETSYMNFWFPSAQKSHTCIMCVCVCVLVA